MSEHSAESVGEHQWRLCGQSHARGAWEGSWNVGEITSNDRHDFGACAKRNDSLWIERRTVLYSPVRVENLK